MDILMHKIKKDIWNKKNIIKSSIPNQKITLIPTTNPTPKSKTLIKILPTNTTIILPNLQPTLPNKTV
jgi:hypothetical protein